MDSSPLIAVEEHWMLPELTSALNSVPERFRDESLAFNDMGDNRRRLENLGAERIAAMDAQGIDVSILALPPPGTHPLPPEDALRLSRVAASAGDGTWTPRQRRCGWYFEAPSTGIRT